MPNIDPEEFRSGGVLPTGSCSLWPKHRNDRLWKGKKKKFVIEARTDFAAGKSVKHNPHEATMKDLASAKDPKVKASWSQMAKGLADSAKTAVTRGKVKREVRDERYETCRSCPAFNHKSKRCSECGCYMEAKTWLNGDKDKMCPLQKWDR